MTRRTDWREVLLSESGPDLERLVVGGVYDAGWIQVAAKDKDLRREWTTAKTSRAGIIAWSSESVDPMTISSAGRTHKTR